MHGEVRYAKCMLVLSEYNFPLDMKCQTVKPRGFFIKLFYSFTLTHTHLYMHAHICHIIYTKMHDIHSELEHMQQKRMAHVCACDQL